MKSRKKSLKDRYISWSYDHLFFKRVFENGFLFIASTISAFIFAFGLRSFLQPIPPAGAEPIQSLVSGGVSGVSQNIALIVELIFPQFASSPMSGYLYSILYFALNIPIFILSWFGVGKRYTIFTLINVLQVSLFTSLLQNAEFTYEIFKVIDANGGLLTRALFAGVCSGIGGAITFKLDFSNGGIDSLAYYFAIKKSTSLGKYSVAINTATVSLFTILSAAQKNFSSASILALASAFFSILFMIVGSFIVDFVNHRNKKVEMKIVTAEPELSKILLLDVPHGQTITKGVGGYSNEERTIITMVISEYEVNSVVKLIKKEDESAFIQVTPLSQVYGHFFIPPIK